MEKESEWEAEYSIIINAVVGSTVHGLNIPGSDDLDTMGICLEPPQYVIGLDHFEQAVYRTKPEGERSSVGDRDSVIYSLRKWARLAVQGNPTIITLMFIPDQFVIESNLLGEDLQRMHPHIISKAVAGPYLGYMRAQRQRLLGERGQKRIKRPEYESKYGYDTKYAMHMLRLGFQGIELLSEGHLTLPMKKPQREYLLEVRLGQITLDQVVQKAGELERALEDARDSSPLQERPNRARVNDFLIDAYQRFWPRQKAICI